MSDPTVQDSPGPGGEPTPEQLRAYLQQLRGADVAEVVAQAFSVLGTGAEVKLGRPDARVLIDALGSLLDTTGPHLPDELTGQMRDGLTQLQLAQVEAEREAAGQAPGGAQPPPADRAPTPEGGGRMTEGGEQTKESGGGRMTDRLWIPGRDQPPPG
ncbi:hypothetical protein BH20ACT9_BH20ACT9_21970 [soil metagenome]